MLAAAGCAGERAPAAPAYPESGLVLVALREGTVRAAAAIGRDPVAVTLSPDGGTAYLADSAPGDVYAVSVPSLRVRWQRHLGGAPFGLLVHAGRLFVSLFDAASVVELEPDDGSVLATHPVPAGPAVLGIDERGAVAVAGTRGQVTEIGGSSTPAGNGFALATVGGATWTADYSRAEIVGPGGRRVGLPLPLFSFWLAPGAGGTLLVAAEGGDEDHDPGGVFRYNPGTGAFGTLARSRDPDQVMESGGEVLVAAHGDRQVLALSGTRTRTLAPGAAAVALAADPAADLLVVAVNAHE